MPGSVFLAGETVALRPVEEEDLAFLRDGDNDPEIRRLAGGDALPVTLDDEREAREDAGRRDAVSLLAAVGDPGEPTRVGYVELDPIDHVAASAELGFWIAAGHRGQGYAREAVELVVGYAFRELRLHRVYAVVYACNGASKRLLRSVGFTEEGVGRDEGFVNGEHVDAHHLSILADEWER